MTIKQIARGKHSRRIYALTAQGVWKFNYVPETEQQLQTILMALAAVNVINKQHWTFAK